MKYLKFMAAGLALLFVFSTSFSNKKVLIPKCKFSVISVTGGGPGYITIRGNDITGQTEGFHYNCLENPLTICTITVDCRTVLQITDDEWYIPEPYTVKNGEFQD